MSPAEVHATESQKNLSALEKAQAMLKQQREIINALTALPSRHAFIFHIQEKSVVIGMGGSLLEVELPRFPAFLERPLIEGELVRINNESAIIGRVSEKYPAVGNVVVAEKVHNNYVEATMSGSKVALPLRNLKVEAGDSLLVLGEMLIYKNFGKQNISHKVEMKVNVSWDDIGGMDDVKEKIKEAIEMPHDHKELFQKYGKKHSKGILLFGPPGNGKTLLGKAAATALAKINGKSSSEGFIYVKGPELLDPYVGVTEAKIRGLFKMAADHFEKNGYPAIIFIDEADSILGARDSMHDNTRIGITTVGTFLAETDGLADSGAMLFLTTNRPKSIDPAILREGRIDRKIRVGRPDKATATAIFRCHIAHKAVDPSKSMDELAKSFSEFLFSMDGAETIISGAMIAQMVETAASFAMKRDIKTGNFTGIQEADVLHGINFCLEQNEALLMHHKED